MADLDALKFQRTQIKSSLTRARTHFAKIADDSKLVLDDKIISDLTIRIARVEDLADKYDNIQSKIEIEVGSVDEDDRQSFETNYYSLVTSVKMFINKYEQEKKAAAAAADAEVVQVIQAPVKDDSNNSDIDKVVQQFKLPTIQLPSFSGSYQDWSEFRDCFSALVNDNKTLSNIQRFYYLRDALKGETRQLLESIQVSEETYQLAWNLLKERFEQKELIIHSHVRAIFEYPSLVKESHVELRKLFDAVTKHLRSLKLLGEPTENWGTLIIYVLTSKLDSKTRREWELFEKESDVPKIADINKFLKQRCEVLEKIYIDRNEKLQVDKFSDKRDKLQTKARNTVSSYAVASDNRFACYYCSNGHSIYKCPEFLKLSIQQRIEAVKKLRLCFNCLRPGHSTRNCSGSSCRICNKTHNSLLHIDTSNKSHTDNKEQNNVTISGSSTVSSNSCFVSQVLLSTAMVKIKDNEGKFHTCRALLDSGSQGNVISEALCKRLKLKEFPMECAVTGVGLSQSKAAAYTNVKFYSRSSKYCQIISCLVMTKITSNLPSTSFDNKLLKISSNIKLADPCYNQSGPIDLLIGSQVFWKLLCVGQFSVENTDLIMQKTMLGWILAGSINANIIQTHALFNCLSNIADDDLNDSLVKFWQIDEVSSKPGLSKSAEYCENHFLSNFKRTENGQFIVKIPLKDNVKDLGDSKEFAKRRFFALEQRLQRNTKLHYEYSSFLSEYIQLGHMSEVSSLNDNTQSYYIPHHAVFKESSVTTRVRVVFDASMKTNSGISLNDVQHVGATLQNDLFSIIVRFRMHEYVMTADISKMYRMILISPEQRSLQRIFWRADPREELRCFELNTVTYGMAASSFLAVRCLFQLADEYKNKYPIASHVIKHDFYMDDLLSGCRSKDELLKLQKEVTAILASGGFELRKWLSNDSNLCEQFAVNNNLEASVLKFGENEASKTLGILWNADKFQYSNSNSTNNRIITKRSILSVVSQIFDPLGLLAPYVVIAKLLIQKLWQAGISWDESVPQQLNSIWLDFFRQLPNLKDFIIDRPVVISDYVYLELHAFADASEKAYGTSIYVRSKDPYGTVKSVLLTAKSRVAPIKQHTLPRLELCAAVLAAQVVDKLKRVLNVNFDHYYYWTDSSVTLCWIKGSPARWKTFVSNRVSEIQRLTNPAQWFHVPTNENPADLVSRGVTLEVLLRSDLWFKGPLFLQVNDINLRDVSQINVEETNSDNMPEQRVNIASVSIVIKLVDFCRYSSATRIIRVIAYIMRIVSILKRKILNEVNNKPSTILDAEELERALQYLLRQAQQESFLKEYEALKSNRPVSKKSKLLSLDPFLDDHDLIRVGGRIQNSNHPYDKRHPIILDSKHYFTRLLMIREHEKYLHCGATTLLAQFRQRFWPIAGKNLAKKVVRTCHRCFHCDPPNPVPQLMGNLPSERVNQAFPFLNVGCDFAGPFLLRDRSTRISRGAKLIKGYVCLFICFATKAIHLEAVSDLTTDCFIATLRRFIGRRGKPSNIYSDNGTNFTSASGEINKLYDFLNSNNDKIREYLAQDSIKWQFIPARAPNFGGLWEANIKRVKYHLIRIIGQTHLNCEDFATVLVQIEAILNSTPLCQLSNEPDQLNALTPAHFILGRPLTALPDRDVTGIKENHLKRYERLQSIIQHFWKRWHTEYLCELQRRNKWQCRSLNIHKIGQVVLIKEENLPPLQWHLGLIKDLHPGNDGLVRVVTVLCKGKLLKRPVSKVRILPFQLNAD